MTAGSIFFGIQPSSSTQKEAAGNLGRFNSYLRAFRWATDRIGDQGVVAFVSNGGWIDSNTADGIRLSLADEYSHIYVYNLRGNARTAGELRKKEKGNVFGSGGRTTIGIFIGVKNPAHTGPREISYRDIGDYLTREDKLRIIADADLDTIDWTPITPNTHGDWVNQRDDNFITWPAIGTKKPLPGETTVFKSFSSGIKTSRDSWCYNFSQKKLRANVEKTAEFYNSEVDRIAAIPEPKPPVDEAITVDSSHFTWDRINKRQVMQGRKIELRDDGFRKSTYRPFTQQNCYFDPQQQLNNTTYKIPSMFPTPHHTNAGFYQVGNGSAVPFSVLMLKTLPDLHVTGAGSGGQFFPRWTYEKVDAGDGGFDFADDTEIDEYGYRRVDNITDEILTSYLQAVGPQVSKDDIFYYVYGQLHDPHYRMSYAADLKKMLPHLPTPESRKRFDAVTRAGRKLAELHTGYETVEPYPLSIELKKGVSAEDRETWRVSNMKWGRVRDEETGKLVNDPTTIIYNPKVTITGIPVEADDYLLGSRSALDWIIYRWQVSTDKASGLVNDPNDWCDEVGNPQYLVDLLARVTTVAVETTTIVNSLGGFAD